MVEVCTASEVFLVTVSVNVKFEAAGVTTVSEAVAAFEDVVTSIVFAKAAEVKNNGVVAVSAVVVFVAFENVSVFAAVEVAAEVRDDLLVDVVIVAVCVEFEAFRYVIASTAESKTVLFKSKGVIVAVSVADSTVAEATDGCSLQLYHSLIRKISCFESPVAPANWRPLRATIVGLK